MSTAFFLWLLLETLWAALRASENGYERLRNPKRPEETVRGYNRLSKDTATVSLQSLYRSRGPWLTIVTEPANFPAEVDKYP